MSSSAEIWSHIPQRIPIKTADERARFRTDTTGRGPFDANGGGRGEGLLVSESSAELTERVRSQGGSCGRDAPPQIELFRENGMCGP
jgi:hypothetical protein